MDAERVEEETVEEPMAGGEVGKLQAGRSPQRDLQNSFSLHAFEGRTAPSRVHVGWMVRLGVAWLVARALGYF